MKQAKAPWTAPETGDSAAAASADVGMIGEPGQPIRALAFAGGGFDTAMQLGVTHAFLVSRAKPPDIVVGASAGAIHAVSLAEVLQAGDVDQQIVKFREIYEALRNAPATIRQAYSPDTFQVDTQRPLESLELPIHFELERTQREEAVASRAGLINLVNTLLRVDVKFGTITRAVRRWLGVRAASEIQNPLQRLAVTGVELFRSWMLLGQNLPRCAPLVWPLLRAAARRGLKGEPGATAGDLIFQSAVWRTMKGAVGYVASLWTLAAAWVFGALLVAIGLTLVGLVPALVIALFGSLLTDSAGLSAKAVLLIAPPLGILAISLVVTRLLGRDRKRAFPASLWALILFSTLASFWTVVIALGFAVPPLLVLIVSGRSWASVLFEPSYWGLAIALTFGVALLVWILLIVQRRSLGRWFLAHFGLDESILDPYPLNQLLVSVFDQRYYGTLNMTQVVETALRGRGDAQQGERSGKLIADYAAKGREPRIHVGLTVADLATGEFRVLHGGWRVVDALGAALAAVPFFPPVPADSPWARDKGAKHKRAPRPAGSVSLLVDSINVANEPTRPLFSFLRHSGLVCEEASALHLYAVSPLPLSREALGPPPHTGKEDANGEYTNLVDVALRALELRRFRDATLERRLTELHTKAMPRDGTIFFAIDGEGGETKLLRSWVYPIEPATPLRVNERVAQSESPAVTRRIIAETVADGCRAALQVMIQPAIRKVVAKPNAATDTPEPMESYAWCHAALQKHLGVEDARVTGSARGTAVDLNPGPGLVEVCEHCAIYRHLTNQDNGRPRFARALFAPTESARVNSPPSWPHRVQKTDAEAINGGQPTAAWTTPQWIEPDRVRARDTADERKIQAEWKGKWPVAREGKPGDQRPTVSMLFSGGVFRGVFQLGALNAFNELSIAPDVVAGASVGSITAAMAARVFCIGNDLNREARRKERAKAILPLSATYLAIDRLVLTDRFSDFIRGITVRAAQAQFSLRDADRALRRFDVARPGVFSRELRDVAAGIEKLTYVSPFELTALLQAFRHHDFATVSRLLRSHFEEWLVRVGVGNEVLGSEPLSRLIQEHVLEGLQPGTTNPQQVPLNVFTKYGIFFLSTTTNLTKGRLETIGEDQLAATDKSTLLGTLLASSAFPGVFRPRWHWEFSGTTTDYDQYIDGGVIDNLPLDAVAQFLIRAARADLLPKRPKGDVPHLLLAASLEPGITSLDESESDALQHYWPGIIRYAKRLRYNQKLDVFARTQRNLRRIVSARKARGQDYTGNEWSPLSLEVVTVIPRWLCSTFAFHPMLGFRRSDQAKSIAHGCASTMLKLAQVQHDPESKGWIEGWGIDKAQLPIIDPKGSDPFLRTKQRTMNGECWYRQGALCPFSLEGQTDVNAPVSGATSAALAEIYRACGQKETHVMRKR